jgi:hypothetical protein
MNQQIANPSAMRPLQRAGVITMHDRPALIFVLLVWAIMFTAALSLIGLKGSNVPSWDDWDMVPTMTGHQPVTLEWLWSQHNEHRDPLPRLVYLVLTRFVAQNLRVGMFFDALATAGLALGLILTVRHVRGQSSYADAFLPIVLLNWGQAANLLWCWEIQFYASMLLAGVLLLVIARGPPQNLLLALAAGICVFLLNFCGANGLGMVPALALWLGYVAVGQWRIATAAARRNAVVLATFAVLSFALVGLYFIGYRPVPFHPSTHNPRVIVKTAIQFLTMGFGPGVVGLSLDHRSPIFFWKFVCAAIVGLFFVTAWMLLTTWRKQPDQRPRVAGLLLFLSAMVSLAFGLGMGRDGFETRYITLSVPAVCAAYVSWSIFGPLWLQKVVGTALFATALAALPANTSWGWQYACDLKSHLSSFEADLKTGTPPYQLVQRHGYYLHPHQEMVMDYMPMLRDAGVGAFGYLRNDPPFREISFPLTPVETRGMQWQDGVARATAVPGWLTFALPSDVNAAGIRLKYTYSNPKGTEPYIALHWKSSDEADFAKDSWTKYSPTGDRANWQQGTWSRRENMLTTLDVWVAPPVRIVRVGPTLGQGWMKIHELTVLVPADNDVHP